MGKDDEDTDTDIETNRSLSMTTPRIQVNISSTVKSDNLDKMKKIAQELMDKYTKEGDINL